MNDNAGVEMYTMDSGNWTRVGSPAGSNYSDWPSVSYAYDTGEEYLAYRNSANSYSTSVKLNQAVGGLGYYGTNPISTGQVFYNNAEADTTGGLYVTYEDLVTDKAWAKYHDGTSWSDAGGGAISDGDATLVSLALDSNDIPYVLYHDDYPWGNLTVKNAERTVPADKKGQGN